MSKDDQSRVVAAAVQAALEAQKMGKGKGKGKGKSSQPNQPSFSCSHCGFYNFEWRTWCAVCKQPRPQKNKGTGKGGQKAWGGGHGKGGGGGNTRETREEQTLREQVRELQRENEELRERKGEEGNDRDDDDEEDEEMEEEGAAMAKADIVRIPELQKIVDAAAGLGNEDPQYKAARERLEAAKAAQRATKPLLAQIQAAERRCEKLEGSLKAAEGRKAAHEKEKQEIDTKITSEQFKIDEIKGEMAKVRGEMVSLHEKARNEKTVEGEGGATATGQQSGTHEVGAAVATLRKFMQLWAGADPNASGFANNLLAQLEGVVAQSGTGGRSGPGLEDAAKGRPLAAPPQPQPPPPHQHGLLATWTGSFHEAEEVARIRAELAAKGGGAGPTGTGQLNPPAAPTPTGGGTDGPASGLSAEEAERQRQAAEAGRQLATEADKAAAEAAAAAAGASNEKEEDGLDERSDDDLSDIDMDKKKGESDKQHKKRVAKALKRRLKLGMSQASLAVTRARV